MYVRMSYLTMKLYTSILYFYIVVINIIRNIIKRDCDLHPDRILNYQTVDELRISIPEIWNL